MITDFGAIKNEKDRAIYAQCREVLDSWFIKEIKLHDDAKDHLMHECWGDCQKIWTDQLRSILKEDTLEGQTVEESLVNGTRNTIGELPGLFQRIIAIETIKAELGSKS